MILLTSLLLFKGPFGAPLHWLALVVLLHSVSRTLESLMDIFTSFATDESKEEDGVVVFLIPGRTDIKVDPWIKVARMGNAAYNKALATTYEALMAAKKAENLTEVQTEIRSKNAMVEVFADTILKGFGNLTFQGDTLPPGKETHLQFLRVKDFRELVVAKASDVELYRIERREAASGN